MKFQYRRHYSIMETFTKFNLFRKLEDILEALSEHESVQSVRQLLDVYNEKKAKHDEEKQQARHPLIILEGLDGSGKTSMTRQLAKKIHGEKRSTPPDSIKFLREYFDSSPTLMKTAYYSLGNYIAALEVACVLHERPVVMDRFWHSTTAYSIAQKVADFPDKFKLPDPSDEVYKWPTDLLKPDRVILLNVSEEIRLERHSRRGPDAVTVQEQLLKDDVKFRKDIIQAYENMREPKITIIDGDGSFGSTLYKLLNNVKPLLLNK